MLKELRTSNGITSSFIAKKLGISRDRLRRIENNKAMLPAEFIPILSNIYGVSYKQMIDRRVEEWRGKKKNL